MNKFRLGSAAVLFISAAVITCTMLCVILIENNSEKSIMKTIGNAEHIYIIDAGHGGEDGGAVAPDGTLEKNLNLDTALRLNAVMKLFGYETITTRENDNAVGDNSLETLRERKASDIKTRAQLLENTENGVLVSIHQNMFSVEKYNGAQIFYSDNNKESKLLAESIREQIKTLIQPYNERTTKPSGKNIYILYHAEKPAIMVECGFLSNNAELQKLKSGEYRAQLAFAVFCGIYEYDAALSNTVIN